MDNKNLERNSAEFTLLTPTDVENLPDLEYLIGGILPEPTFGVLYGAPGSGKSFVALSMSLAIASGEPWFDLSTRQGKVLYVAAEGALGMKNRLAAYRNKFEINDENIRFIGVPFDIRSGAQVSAIIKSLNQADFQPSLIIVDTLARVAVGADENSAKDMGQVVDGFETLKRETGASILAIHHTRKDGGPERGSSSLRGACDVMIGCEAMDADGLSKLVLKCEKMKDDEPFPEIGLKLEKVVLPGGKSSLVITGTTDAKKAKTETRDQILGLIFHKFKNKGVVHKDLHAAFFEAGFGSKSKFDREWKTLKDTEFVYIDNGAGRDEYFVRNPEKLGLVSAKDKEGLKELGELLSGQAKA